MFHVCLCCSLYDLFALLCVMFTCVFVRSGTLLYQFMILAFFLTLTVSRKVNTPNLLLTSIFGLCRTLSNNSKITGSIRSTVIKLAQYSKRFEDI